MRLASANCALKTFVTLIAVIIPVNSEEVPPPASARERWELVWQDDFDQSGLDTRKWNIRTGLRGDASNAPDAIRATEGILSIIPFSREGKHYSGFLDTDGIFEQTFGYFEARIRFKSKPGEWGGFWLQSKTMGNPVGNVAEAGAEIDIVEQRARDSANQDVSGNYTMDIHWDGYKEHHQHSGAQVRKLTTPNAWHTFGLLWTEGGYSFYLDDKLQWRTNTAVSHRSQFLRLTCEIDEGWAGTVPDHGYAEAYNQTIGMDVDWVRIWKHK